MRLFFASLFLLFGLVPAFADSSSSREIPLLVPDQNSSLAEWSLAQKTPAERRQALTESLQFFDHMASKLTRDIDYWSARLPERGVGIQIEFPSILRLGGLSRHFVTVTDALPQSAASEQLCPGDRIRSVDGVNIPPFTIVEGEHLNMTIERSLKYGEQVARLIRSAKGVQVAIVVERNGRRVELSPRVEVYERFRKYAEDRIASVRAYLLKEKAGVERFRGVVQSGSDSEVVIAIREVRYAIDRVEDASEKGIPANFGTPRFCPNE